MIRHLKRTFTRAVALAAVLVAATSASAQQPIRVGANIGNVPWEFQNEKGENVGFEIDLMTEVGKRLKRPVAIVNIPFQGLFAAVQSGQIDAAVSSITITQKRLESVSFAQPYYDSDQSLTVTKASGIKALEGMAGKTVGVDTGSTGDMWATQNKDKYKFGDIRRFEGLNPAMLDLAAGRLDGYISDIPALQYYAKDKPQFEVIQRIPTGEQYSVMFAKDAPLAKQVNEVVTEMKTDGTMAKLHEKWFGKAPEAETSTAKVMPMPAPKS
ncbi:transporter substrate-binding domain-containing protein [Salinarimonas soli]|uniref:Transporter substrate-binding domain-containing protein n=1 Tax=Salinarimonas soli TaxID=1638099 RepID=A0A5B2VYH7_9HYPH|nr:transporter substrate-binding domain-containing protein [Salinarimonas soli]KAA2244095.1 transporter substrate-binding domain-containing protein [Salinarimonas soli]